MPDPTLHGNGYICQACELRREADRRLTVFGNHEIPCNQCKGTGRIAKTTAQIVSEHVAWARENYWSKKTYA